MARSDAADDAGSVGYRIQLWASAWDSDRPGCLPESYEPWRLAGASSEEEFISSGGRAVLREFKRDSNGRMAHIQLTIQRRKQVAYTKLQREKGQAGARKRWQRPSPSHAPAIPRPSHGHSRAHLHLHFHLHLPRRRRTLLILVRGCRQQAKGRRQRRNRPSS